MEPIKLPKLATQAAHSDVTLGQLIEGEATRDAIHVAIAPVVAGVNLKPGWHVKLNEAGEAFPTTTDNPIGIVDPFLKVNVEAGQKFWLCLYQKTVTGMKHHWSHPAFPDKDESIINNTLKAEAEKTIKKIIEPYGIEFQWIIEAYKNDNYYCHGQDDYPNEDEQNILIPALQVYTGIIKEGFYFRCAC